MISLVGLGAPVDSLSGIAVAFGYPAGIASGDLLLVPVRMRATSATAPAPNNALTWVEAVVRGTAHKLFAAFYDGVTAAPTINPGGANLGAIMLALRGVDPANPFGNTATFLQSQTAVHYPGLTVANDNSYVLTFSSVGAALTAVTHDPAFTELYRFNSAITTLGFYLQGWLQTSKTDFAGNDLTTVPGTLATQLATTIVFNALGATQAPGGNALAGGFSGLFGGFGG